jgi:hypothetical protein
MTDATIKEVLDLILKTADLHANRMIQAMNYLSPMMPMTGDKLNMLTMDQLAYSDTFIGRFSKLQDIMGAKLFGLVLEWAEEGPYDTFLDKLHALERLGCISDAQQWIKLRDMRNYLSHDYPDELNRAAGYFNEAYAMTSFLLSCLENIKSFVDTTTRKREAL